MMTTDKSNEDSSQNFDQRCLWLKSSNFGGAHDWIYWFLGLVAASRSIMGLFLCPASSSKKWLKCLAGLALATRIQHVLLVTFLVFSCWTAAGNIVNLIENHACFLLRCVFSLKCHGKLVSFWGLRMPLMMTEEAPWITPGPSSRCPVGASADHIRNVHT